MTDLTVDQQQAKEQFKEFLLGTEHTEMVLGGHSGTGKSFLVDELIKETNALNKVGKLLGSDKKITILCTATTNQAARVLANKVNQEASTIHKLLGLTVKNDYKTGKTFLKKSRDYTVLTNSLVILDEASMIDSFLLKTIRDSLLNCKILYVGDPYQLPPVFETGCPVFQSVDEQALLTTIKRQANGSSIIPLGDELRKAVETGVFPSLELDTHDIKQVTGDEFRKLVHAEFTRPNNSKILAWENSKVNQYNKYVRGLNVPAAYADKFMVGEKVITNGPINSEYPTDSILKITDVQEGLTHYGMEGYGIELDKNVDVFLPKRPHEASAILKQLAKEKNWKDFFDVKEKVADLRPTYSCTVHKSQGSTYDNVFIDLDSIGRNNKWNEVARLLYVAVTRASNNVYLYGDLPDKYKG